MAAASGWSLGHEVFRVASLARPPEIIYLRERMPLRRMNGMPAVDEPERTETLTPGSRVVRSPGILSAPCDGELLLIQEATSDCFALRGSGVEIWQAAGEPIAIEDICEGLQRVYQVDAATCRSNVLRQVEELLRQGLFVLVR